MRRHWTTGGCYAKKKIIKVVITTESKKETGVFYGTFQTMTSITSTNIALLSTDFK